MSLLTGHVKECAAACVTLVATVVVTSSRAPLCSLQPKMSDGKKLRLVVIHFHNLTGISPSLEIHPRLACRVTERNLTLMHTSDCVVKERIGSGKRSTCCTHRTLTDQIMFCICAGKSIKRCFDVWNERDITNGILIALEPILNASVAVGAVVDHSHRPPVADCPNAILFFIPQCDANFRNANSEAIAKELPSSLEIFSLIVKIRS